MKLARCASFWGNFCALVHKYVTIEEIQSIFPPHMTARENQYPTNASEESQMVSYSWSCTFHSVVLPFLLCSHLYLQCCIPC